VSILTILFSIFIVKYFFCNLGFLFLDNKKKTREARTRKFDISIKFAFIILLTGIRKNESTNKIVNNIKKYFQ